MRPFLMSRQMLAFSAVTMAAISAQAQVAHLLPADALAVATIPASSSSLDEATSSSLPNAPSAVADDTAQTGSGVPQGNAPNFARRYDGIIFYTETAKSLNTHQKVIYGYVRAVQPINVLAWASSAAYSQAVNSAPHYGEGWAPYGQRIGAAAARQTVQTLATDSLFAPLLHDDPRYYELGPQHHPVRRTLYAVSRVVVTRSDDGARRVNLPLFAGYALSAASTNAYYPSQDRTASRSAETFGASLGGAALGFFFDEFVHDLLSAAHLRK